MDAILNQVQKAVSTMDLPKNRKQVVDENGQPNWRNIGWLHRNIRFRNREHPQLSNAIHFIKTMLVMRER